MKLNIEENDSEDFTVDKATASELSLEGNEILIGKNPINQKAIAGGVEMRGDMEKDKIGITRHLYESIGLDTGFEIEVEKYESELIKVKEVEFGFEDQKGSSEDPLSVVKENEEEFIDFIQDKIFTKNSKFYWDEEGLLVSVEKTYPEMEGDQVGDFTEVEDCTYVWGGSELKSFDGVLLIDISGSMETKDLKMEDIDWVVERIDSGIQGEVTSGFLSELKERMNIKRSEGAVFCALMYLVQKIGRGVGDKISVVPFSTDAGPIDFQDQRFFSSRVGTTKEAAENIIEHINYAKRGRTNISGALEEAIEVMKDFDRGKMKMVVVLTDGEPNPPSVDDPRSVKKVVEERLAPRKDVVVNTIGLGDQVDHQQLDKVASMTGGEYTYVNSLQGLTQAYSRYATSISVKATAFSD
ncbi:MAG: vWA domain-containing protein [Candidatus Natronoplasma sp.]